MTENELQLKKTYEESSAQCSKPVVNSSFETRQRKREAFLRMEELRKEMAQYDFSEEDRRAALEEKHGVF